MKLPGRFEGKILAAMVLVAALSVGNAVLVLRTSLRGFSGYSLERQRELGAAARRAADVWKTYFASRKDEFARRTQLIARDPPPHLEALAGEPDLLEARVLVGNEAVETWEAPPELQRRMKDAPPFIALVAPKTQASPEILLELKFGIPLPIYQGFTDIQRALNDDRDSSRAMEAAVSETIRDYLRPVIAVLVVASALGFFFARRATGRVLRLRDAARRVGEGDLSVRVEPKGKDELDELARAFDRMVAELADARSRLEYLQKVSAWQEVARRLAHEIKNPLTPIQLAVQELAMKYTGDDPQYRQRLDTATEILREEIAGLRRLVDDFSAFAKLPKVDPQPLDLGALVTEFARLHPEWQHVVEVDVGKDPVTAPCDKTLFRRVLANLVENAVHAAEGAGRAPRVSLRVEARPLRQRAAILVDDNGPGVPAGQRQRVFDPYVTHKEGGTGLGLAIVRKIVIDHGGDVIISAAPAPLGGARFEVEIPAG